MIKRQTLCRLVQNRYVQCGAGRQVQLQVVVDLLASTMAKPERVKFILLAAVWPDTTRISKVTRYTV